MNAPSSTPRPELEGQEVTTAVTASGLDAASAVPGGIASTADTARPHALKVLCGNDELAAITRAADIAGSCVSASLSAG